MSLRASAVKGGDCAKRKEFPIRQMVQRSRVPTEKEILIM